MGDNVFIGILIISVLLSRYDNNHNNYMKDVMNIKHAKKTVHLHMYYHAKVPVFPKKALEKCESTRQATYFRVFFCAASKSSPHIICAIDNVSCPDYFSLRGKIVW